MFRSKVLGNVVSKQLLSCLDLNGTTEQILIRFYIKPVMKHFLMNSSGNLTVLLLLDFGSALDIVDDNIFLSPLNSCDENFSSGMNQIIFVCQYRLCSFWGNTLSLCPHLTAESQVAILGPILFPLNQFLLSFIFKKYNFACHCFTHDLQMYLPIQESSELLL